MPRCRVIAWGFPWGSDLAVFPAWAETGFRPVWAVVPLQVAPAELPLVFDPEFPLVGAGLDLVPSGLS